MHGVRPARSLASRRLGLVVVITAVLLGTFAPAASAQQRGRRKSDGPRVVLTGRVDVGAKERTDAVVILDGSAVIAGDVNGAVVAFNGDVRVRGNVDESVVVLHGRAIIDKQATVGGDVVSSERPRVAPGARVDGQVRRVNFANYFRALGWLLWVAWWLAVSVSMLVLGLLLLALVPRAATSTVWAARGSRGAVIGWGLLLGVGLPLASVLALITLVGIPLGLIGLCSLALVYPLGYVTGALVLGRQLMREPRSVFGAFVVGLVILRVIALVPVLGGLVTAATTVVGLGALTVAAWRARRVRTSPPAAGDVHTAPST
jgi:hypothetical protein